MEEQLNHIDSGAYDKHDAARGTDLFLHHGVWQEIREQHQVIHDDNQLELVEDVHIAIELGVAHLDVASSDDNGYTQHEEDKHLQP